MTNKNLMQKLRNFKNENSKEMLRLMLLKWLCDQNQWASKHMHVLTGLFNKEFTTKDLPYKSSRSYELVKQWEQKGLIRMTDYISKAKKYAFTTTLFAKTIEQAKVGSEVKEGLLEILDELITF